MRKLITILFYIITIISTLVALYILITDDAFIDIKTLALLLVFIGIACISNLFAKGKDDTFY